MKRQTIKEAHWVLNEDNSFSWLCGDDAHGFDYREAEYDPTPETDEELVDANKGCPENRFTAILTKAESNACDNGLSDEELRFLIVERVHQARGRVAVKNGTTYNRESTTRGAVRESRPLSDLATKTMADSENSRLTHEKMSVQTGIIAPFIYSIVMKVRKYAKSSLINS